MTDELGRQIDVLLIRTGAVLSSKLSARYRNTISVPSVFLQFRFLYFNAYDTGRHVHDARR